MNKEIKVNILEENDNVYLNFQFDEPVKINITSDDQENIKSMFQKILEYIINNEEISFIFHKEKDDLYSETAQKYIEHLNSELKTLKQNYKNPKTNKYSE